MKFDFSSQIKQKTDEELTEIFINAKDYNPDFLKLAEQELAIRKIDLDLSKQIKEELKETNTNQLKEGKAGSALYLLLCFVLALLGGLIAIYAGYIYSYSKIKTSEGEEYFTYNEQTRELGKIIMWLGIGIFFVTINLALNQIINNYQLH